MVCASYYGTMKRFRRNSSLEIHRQIFRDHRNNMTKEITQAIIEYYTGKLTGADQVTALR